MRLVAKVIRREIWHLVGFSYPHFLNDILCNCFTNLFPQYSQFFGCFSLRTNRFAFITEMECVYWAVRIDPLKTIEVLNVFKQIHVAVNTVDTLSSLCLKCEDQLSMEPHSNTFLISRMCRQAFCKVNTPRFSTWRMNPQLIACQIVLLLCKLVDSGNLTCFVPPSA